MHYLYVATVLVIENNGILQLKYKNLVYNFTVHNSR